MIGLTLDLPVTEREEGTLVTTVMAVQSHYGFVRVHDAEKNRRAIKMTEVILEESKQEKKMDQIKIENLEIFANHGVYPEENRLGQKFLVSCILYVDTRKAGKTDDLEASVNYGTISHLIKEKMEEKNYRLIEAVAEQLAEEILLFDEKIRKVMVEVKKPWAPVGLPLETVSVKIERCWNEAFIALGSNMGDKKKYIENAVEELKMKNFAES